MRQPEQPPPYNYMVSTSDKSPKANNSVSDDHLWEDLAEDDIDADGESQGESSHQRRALNASPTKNQRQRPRVLRTPQTLRARRGRSTTSIPQSPTPKSVLNGIRRRTEDERTGVPQVIPTDDQSDLLQTEHLARHARRGFIASLKYVFDILSGAISLLRKPLSVIVFLYMLAFLLGRLWPTLWVAFSPLCRVPGVSRMEICRPPSITLPPHGPPRVPGANYPKLIDVQSRTFEKLLIDSSDYTGLSTEIKRAEMATSDLMTLVRGSQLVSRETLADVLYEFVNDAKKTGKSLQKFHAKVGGAVDDILAINDWALKTIEAAEASAPSGFSIQALMPWAPSQSSIRATVTRTFTDSMGTVSSNLRRLILEAEISLGHLNSLEEKLNTLYEILKREDIFQKEERDEILKLLWTKLGGNKKKLKGVDNHLMLLRDLHVYRRRARAHVVGALQTLGEMNEGIEDIRERAAAPALLASDDEGNGKGDIPVQVHVQSIKMGLERLRDGRKRAKLIEQAVIRKVLSASDLEDGREIGSGSDFLDVMD